MKKLEYALITPSFRGDLDRCRLLLESVDRFVAPDVRHYLVVDRRDQALFQPFVSSRTTLCVVEDVAPSWIRRIPAVRKFWLSTRSRPVRNWILQQIVKLSMVSHIPDDVLLFVDSDTFFARDFDPRTLEKEGRVPLYVERGKRGVMPSFNDAWHQTASRVLDLPPEDVYDTNFIGNVICWHRQHAIELQERLAAVAKADWPLALVGQRAFSEYILYGMFVTQSLSESESRHWEDGLERTHCHWKTTPLDEAGLREFQASIQDHHHSVMISAKSHTPVDLIRKCYDSTDGLSSRQPAK